MPWQQGCVLSIQICKWFRYICKASAWYGKRLVSCPKIIANYNKHMGGVNWPIKQCATTQLVAKEWNGGDVCFGDFMIRQSPMLLLSIKRIHPMITKSNHKSSSECNLHIPDCSCAAAYQLWKGPSRPHTTSLSRLTGKHFIYRHSIQKKCVVCAYKKTLLRVNKQKGTKIMSWCPKCRAYLCVARYFEAYYSRVNCKKFWQ